MMMNVSVASYGALRYVSSLDFQQFIFTARSELRKVLFMAPPVCGFCLSMKYR